MKAGLWGAVLGGALGGLLAGSTLILVLIPAGVVVGAICGFTAMTAFSAGDAEESARHGYRVVCPSTAELVTVKLDPARARWSELTGGRQVVTRCSGHWNGPPKCGYPCVSQVKAERAHGVQASAQKHWELHGNQRQVVIEGFGRSKEEAFAEVALATTAIVTAPNRITPTETVEISCPAAPDASLLCQWVRAVIGESRSRGLVFSDFDVHISRLGLQATAKGERIAAAKHRPVASVEAVRPDSVQIASDADGGWSAQCAVSVAVDAGAAQTGDQRDEHD